MRQVGDRKCLAARRVRRMVELSDSVENTSRRSLRSVFCQAAPPVAKPERPSGFATISICYVLDPVADLFFACRTRTRAMAAWSDVVLS